MIIDENRGSDGTSRLIYSRNNIHIKRLRSLQDREGREQTGLFLIEGIRPLAQAVAHGVRIETLIVAPQLLTIPFGRRVVRQIRIAGTPCLSLTPEVYYSFTQAEEPQGVAAVVKQRWEPLETLRPSNGLCWIAAEAVQSPGNLGTMIRSSDAVGGAGIILLGNATDPYDPATVRASMGAIFAQRFVRGTVEQFAIWKRRNCCTVVGTSPDAKTDYQDVVYPRPTMLLLGCEKRGLTPELQSLCDVMVKIPMVGRSDSLNVAVATSVMLYELFNQRRRARSQPGEKGIEARGST
ncbi:MAG TPA: RNA methyltransferase [Chthonomonadaceae bacterium]|nr:RNA methyltransferase [Chthonomonadaceae bacterium]